LSIRPEYASAIFSGAKQFEFRRSIFRKPVDTVVVYITHPVGLVFGEFDVHGIIHDRVDDLWKRTRDAAGIDRELFFQYFAGREYGYAIQVGNTRRYKQPLCLMKHYGLRPPQSFLYLDDPMETKTLRG
jgi:predicted transcriptional regulator